MVVDGNFIFIGLIVLAGLLTILLLMSRSILFGIAAGVSWFILGILLLTNQLVKQVSETATAVTDLGVTTTTTTITTTPIFSETFTQLLGYLFIAMTFACLIYYIGGLGRQRITITDGKKTWSMWGQPPKEPIKARSVLVKERHREKLKTAREHRRLLR